ncbi:hypothetical protein C8R46DRAFT_1103942 [Mycena filopes]|nr:hypothetical protein C8R46DRAFT_1103942 [Mycena filopes]
MPTVTKAVRIPMIDADTDDKRSADPVTPVQVKLGRAGRERAERVGCGCLTFCPSRYRREVQGNAEKCMLEAAWVPSAAGSSEIERQVKGFGFNTKSSKGKYFVALLKICRTSANHLLPVLHTGYLPANAVLFMQQPREKDNPPFRRAFGPKLVSTRIKTRPCAPPCTRVCREGNTQELKRLTWAIVLGWFSAGWVDVDA